MELGSSDAGATAGTGGRDDAAILVLKVWRDPAFRARITIERQGADVAEQAMIASETAVLDFVRGWLERPADT